MKKFASVILAVLMMLTASIAFADAAATDAPSVAMGQSLYAAHGTKCFTVATVAMEGDVIVGAYLDDFQFMAADTSVGVPNSDVDFGESYPEGKVLGSKKANNETYSANMAERGGSTVEIKTNLELIEQFCVGKTVADLQAAIEGVTEETAVDVVSGCTLVDTVGYINAIIEAANSIAA